MNGAANDGVKPTSTEDTFKDSTEANDQSAGSAQSTDKQNASSHPHLVVVSSDSPSDAHLMSTRLRTTRETLGVTIEKVAQETKIHKDYITALEANEPHILPGMPRHQTYLRGYLKTYARYLGFKDQDGFADCYLEECGFSAGAPATTLEPASTAKASRPAPVRKPLSQPRPAAQAKTNRGVGAKSILLAILIVALSGAAMAWFLGPWSKPVAATPTPAEPPVLTSPVEAAPAVVQPEAAPVETIRPGIPAAAPNLSLKAIKNGWITVTGSDGTVYLSKEMEAGQVYLPRVNAGWTVTVRDGGAFEWRLNGQSLGLLGAEGAPAYALSVDEALNRQPVVTD